jgi:hypothetical protein
MEGFSLNTFVLWLISGGATIVARLVIARIPVMQAELSESERGAVTALVSVIVIAAAFVGAAYVGYIPMPQTGLEWFEGLFVPVATALGLPALMTATMQVKETSAARSQAAFTRTTAPPRPDANRLFGILW